MSRRRFSSAEITNAIRRESDKFGAKISRLFDNFENDFAVLFRFSRRRSWFSVNSSLVFSFWFLLRSLSSFKIWNIWQNYQSDYYFPCFLMNIFSGLIDVSFHHINFDFKLPISFVVTNNIFFKHGLENYCEIELKILLLIFRRCTFVFI